jgi:radical SAM superfamily enzyme
MNEKYKNVFDEMNIEEEEEEEENEEKPNETEIYEKAINYAKNEKYQESLNLFFHLINTQKNEKIYEYISQIYMILENDYEAIKFSLLAIEYNQKWYKPYLTLGKY